jgi:hypothetical protein
MPDIVYRVMDVLCMVVQPLPIGTNLGMTHLLWMLLSGQLLTTRGAIFSGLSAVGLPAPAVRRAWLTLAHGAWTIEQLLAQFRRLVETERLWEPHTYECYHPVAVDVTGFWRPRLKGCATSHYNTSAGKALPAIPLGLVARIGEIEGQRLGLPLTIVRVDQDNTSPQAHNRKLIQQAVRVCQPDDVIVTDRGFGVRLLQEEQVVAWVTRLPKNFTARRASPPVRSNERPSRGRPPTRGALVRPLARQRKGHLLPATPPDEVTIWTEGVTTIRAEQWFDLVRADANSANPHFTVVAIHDPHYLEPLLLATPLPLTPLALRNFYRDRWPVEQIPLAAKQMLGAERQFVHSPECCQRWPELTLLAGAMVSYLAASQPAVPTGFWDRKPQPTSGRFRRVLARYPFPEKFPLPARIHEKSSVTGHLPKGFWGQRHKNPEAERLNEPATATRLTQRAA